MSFPDGCISSSSLYIYYIPSEVVPSDVSIPTGFSPNNDGANDTWTISGLENYPNATINVFNRWGQLLFEGGPSNPTWNGSYLGELLPTADYYYIIDLGEGSKYNGVVTLKQ
jgi:gliding motility-associated-like protein